MWQYLRDVAIVLLILLAVSGFFVAWTIFTACALGFTYLATLFMGYRGLNGKTK